MKSINEYIEGIEPGQMVPAIKGEVVQITPPSEPGKSQVVTIQSDQRIKLYIKSESDHIADDSVGHILSAASSRISSGFAGLTLKHNTSGKPYIVTSSGVSMSVDKVAEEKNSAPVSEPMSENEYKIKAYTEDRLYVYSLVSAVVAEFNESAAIPFPKEKLPELATSAHMFAEKSCGVGRLKPTHTHRVRKEVHQPSVTEKKKAVSAAKKEEPATEAGDKSADSGSWRTFIHPKSGRPLGDTDPKTIKTQLAKWYYSTDPSSLKPEIAAVHLNIGKAIHDLGFTTDDILNAYIQHYASEEFKNSAKLCTEAVVKFANGLESGGLTEGNILDDGKATKTQFLAIMRDFPALWKSFVEGDSSDE